MDTETTGFRSGDRIVELAFVHFKGGEVADSFHSRVNPKIYIPEDATRIHGITDSDVRDAPTMDDLSPMVMTWLAEMDNGPLIAHQLHFDLRMLRQSLGHGLDLSRPAACSLDYAKVHHPVLSLRGKGHKVSDLVDFFGIDVDMGDAHGAMFDAHTTGLFVPHLFRGAPESILRPLHWWEKAKG